ncbi:signal recognition particle protein [Candidatus Woesearchaeota archaeon]|nr:signal recognition particle protein [Candidatus Woesearchaeota archaeon]
MVLDNLGNSLKETLKKIARAVFVDERIINELVKDIQKALLQSDVNVQLVFDLTKSIKDRALKEKPPAGIPQKEHIIKIVYEELVKFLGEEKSEIVIEKKKPFKIMMVGLFGSGKTTTIGKLAGYYSKRGYKVGALGLDIHRPAAMDQIEQVAKQVNIPYFIDKKQKDVIKIYNEYEKEFSKFDILLIDTAGRDALSKDLIEEIEKLNQKIMPDERILVISADIGQAAKTQAEQFHKSCNITGVIVTKLDGTAKGGGALSACAVVKAPIKFIGIGEKLDDLETFNPKGFVSRILGMGDIEALLEKAKEAVSEEDAKEMSKKLLKGEFSFIDLYEQMQSMKKMGSLSKIAEMIPGFSNMNIPKEMLNVQEEKLDKWRYIFDICTKEELEDPDIIDGNRISRIAKGSGISATEIRELLKQYKQSKKLMKLVKDPGSAGDLNKLMKKFQGKLPKGFKF